MEKKLILLLAPLLLFWHWFEPAARRNQEGLHAYDQGRYADALQQFLAAKGIKPGSAALKNNTAAALYEMKKYREALEEFSKIDPEKSGLAKENIRYNQGNACYRLQQYEQALENYKQCLLANPNDRDAKINYELTLKKLQQGQPPPPAQSPQNLQNPPPRQDQALAQYLNQNEKEQMEKKKRKANPTRRQKDW